MSTIDDAIAAYNAKAKSDYHLGVDRANERDVADRVAVAAKANEVLCLNGHDEVLWWELTTSTVDKYLLYHFTALGYKFIGYMERARFSYITLAAAKPQIEMAIAPWASIESSGAIMGDFLWTKGYDKIYSFAHFGEAVLAHMYEHKMPDRLKVAVTRKRDGALGRYTAVLDGELYKERVSVYPHKNEGTRMERYEQMLQRYRAMGGRPGAAAPAPTKEPEKKKGTWCWSRPAG